MMNPSCEFTCEISHHAFDRAQLYIKRNIIAEPAIVQIEVFDNKDKPDRKNSKIALTLDELREISSIAESFFTGSEIMKEPENEAI